MSAATAADRRALIERARHRLTKTRAPGMTWVGKQVLVDLALEDLDRVAAIDAAAAEKARPRPAKGDARNGL